MNLKKKTRLFDDLIKLIGVENTFKLMQYYGGKTVYIPKIDTFLDFSRNVRIYTEYVEGASLISIAKRWQLHRHTVKAIVAKMEGKKEIEAYVRKVIKNKFIIQRYKKKQEQ